MFRHLAARRAACLVLSCTALLAGCSNDEEPTATASSTTEAPSPTPTPEPTWTLRPVAAERTATVLPLGSGPLLGLGGMPEPDQAAIDAATTAVGDWLDRHLGALQQDGTGLWSEIAADGLADAETREPVTTGLASPDDPVKSARYAMTVYQDGAPQYLTVRVEVTHPDDTVSEQGLVFVIGDDGQPTLSLVGPEPETEAAE